MAVFPMCFTPGSSSTFAFRHYPAVENTVCIFSCTSLSITINQQNVAVVLQCCVSQQGADLCDFGKEGKVRDGLEKYPLKGTSGGLACLLAL